MVNIVIKVRASKGGHAKVSVCFEHEYHRRPRQRLKNKGATRDEITYDREFDVIKRLPDAQVRGLLEVWDMQYAQIKDPYVTTASFPAGGRVLKAPRKDRLGRSGLSSSDPEHRYTKAKKQEHSLTQKAVFGSRGVNDGNTDS